MQNKHETLSGDNSLMCTIVCLEIVCGNCVLGYYCSVDVFNHIPKLSTAINLTFFVCFAATDWYGYSL